MEHLNPRGARVVALEKPSEVERGQWYFQRYVQHLPTAGEIVLFDRSWYNRAGVERVMGFCTDDEYDEFMRQSPEFERNLVRSGIHLIKFWFSVSREEQRRRFKERKSHPLKQWKLSPIDLASLDKWDEYTKAKEAMFFYTDTADSPWTVIKSDCKKRARLNAMRYVLHRLPYTEQGRRADRARSTRCWSGAPTSSTSAAKSTRSRWLSAAAAQPHFPDRNLSGSGRTRGGAAALVDRPHHQALAAPAVARGEDALDAGRVAAIFGLHVAARVAVRRRGRQQRLLRPEEAHRQQHQLRGPHLLGARHFHGHQRALVVALPVDLTVTIDSSMAVGVADELLHRRQVDARIVAELAAASSWP